MSYRKFITEAYNNVAKYGTTDVDLFGDFFELKLLAKDEVKKEIIDFIDNALTKKSDGSYDFKQLKMKKIGSVLVPKKAFFAFRKCALIDFVDEVMFLSIVLIMAPVIEKNRINKSEKVVFSYRYKPHKSLLFDDKYNFTSFREHISKKSKSPRVNVVVETDISNFYDRLNLHRLESNLLSLNGIDKELVKLLNEILLFWSNRDSYGLPVGSNGSRILAESLLSEVDDFLKSNGIDFCRFVDDYRIFAKDAYTAQKHLSLLVQKLNDVGLFINTNKTNVREPIKDLKTKSKDSKVEKTIFDEHQFGVPNVIRGYSGLIPTKFRKLTKNEITKYATYDIKEKIKEMTIAILVKPNDIIELSKAIVANSMFDNLQDLVIIVKKFPQFLPYITDVIIKNERDISDGVVMSIKSVLGDWMKQEELLEYTHVYLTRLFSSGRFTNTDLILSSFKNLKRNSGVYVGRAYLDGLKETLFRNDVIELKKYYERADIWEKRQILRLVNINLETGEKRAFFKDVINNTNDVLVKHICSDKNLKLLK